MWALLLACAQPMDFDPPDNPPHDDNEEGARHARGKQTPLLCGGQTCPEDGTWPADEDLSCDAYGCHGANT